MMIRSIRKFFGGDRPQVDYSQMVKDGAMIIDVRSKAEFGTGHIEGSVNIPLDTLASNLNKLGDKKKTIITCCASGVRSASAKNILDANGYTSVYNGGAWQSLNRKLT